MNIEQISNQLTEKIKSEFKTQMTNRYAIYRENSEVDNFIKHCLSVNGTIGKVAHDKIEWSALLEDMQQQHVTYRCNHLVFSTD